MELHYKLQVLLATLHSSLLLYIQNYSKKSTKKMSQPRLKWFSVLDAAIGWLPFAVSLGKRIVAEERIDVIYARAGKWKSGS